MKQLKSTDEILKPFIDKPVIISYWGIDGYVWRKSFLKLVSISQSGVRVREYDSGEKGGRILEYFFESSRNRKIRTIEVRKAKSVRILYINHEVPL